MILGLNITVILNHGFQTYFEMALQDRMMCFRQFAIDLFISLYFFIFNYIILHLSSGHSSFWFAKLWTYLHGIWENGVNPMAGKSQIIWSAKFVEHTLLF